MTDQRQPEQTNDMTQTPVEDATKPARKAAEKPLPLTPTHTYARLRQSP